MTVRFETPQSRCKVGFARADITPPVGIYHRMWGAAKHDRATGVHRPLTATALCLGSIDGSACQMMIGLDHCLLDREEFVRIRNRIHIATGFPLENVFVSMSHTHGSAWMSRERAHLPGGDLIGPYLDQLSETCARIATEAVAVARNAFLLYGTSRCSLARHRDFWDDATKQYVCGFHPAGPADDTLLIAKAIADDGQTLGTVVNYSCHPTTLAWENTLISPDYVGAMRETVENQTGAFCLFLQGASGDLGPREGFVGDTRVADRNGHELGYAALGGMESLVGPGMAFEYVGPVVSGAILGTWEYRPTQRNHSIWEQQRTTVNLQYRLELPTEHETRAELAKWQAEETAARTAGNENRVRDCRARTEQMTRQLARIAALPQGRSYPFPVAITRIGDAIWVFTPGELYQYFQLKIRERFPKFAILVATLTNDWQPGYLPTATSYGYGIYQDVIAAVSAGSLETLTESVCKEIAAIVQ